MVSIGARISPYGAVILRLRSDQDLLELERAELKYTFRQKSRADRLRAIADFATNTCTSVEAEVLVVASITPGSRMRAVTPDRLYYEACILLGACRAGIPEVLTASSRELKRRISVSGQSLDRAMDIVCDKLHVESGRMGAVRRTQYDLDALAAAALGLIKRGAVLPTWIIRPY